MDKYIKGVFNDIDYKVYKKKQGKEYHSYINLAMGLDIETTSLIYNDNKVAFMYEWTIGIKDGEHIYYNRTMEDLISCLDDLSDLFKTDDYKHIIIYVHNLGYEFQFLKNHLDIKNVFAVKERKPIKVELTNGIILMDSFILSGGSLDYVSKNLQKHKVKKLIGDLDYNLIRHSGTPLTEKELEYCYNDVYIILCYINEQIEQYHDNITHIPLTNTGRVRKYVKNYCMYGSQGKHRKFNRYYRNTIKGLTLTKDEYVLGKHCFMGGFTHANAYKTGESIENVSSIDFTSSYPYVMTVEQYPMSKGIKVDTSNLTLSEFEKICEKNCCIMKIAFKNIAAKITYDNYLSVSKCVKSKNMVENNGRVFKADFIETNITNVDYDIIKQVYNYDSIAILELYKYRKHYLPKPLIESILTLYEDKTKLKGVKGKEQEYLLKKGMLNSIYGMTVTDIVRDENIYNTDENIWELETVNIDDEIEKYNNKFDRVLFYLWGVFVTAYARKNLWTGILNIKDDYIYSDTDSIKFTNLDKHKPFIKAYNEMVKHKIKNVCDYYDIDKSRFEPKTIKGVSKMLGVWDYEGTSKLFKTLGAKRYMYYDDDLHITVAGLGKKQGKKYILNKCKNDIKKCFEFFNNNMYVDENNTGKKTHTYIDQTLELDVIDYTGIKKHVKVASGIYLGGCEFTMSMSDKYLEYLSLLNKGYITKII